MFEILKLFKRKKKVLCENCKGQGIVTSKTSMYGNYMTKCGWCYGTGQNRS